MLSSLHGLQIIKNGKLFGFAAYAARFLTTNNGKKGPCWNLFKTWMETGL